MGRILKLIREKSVACLILGLLVVAAGLLFYAFTGDSGDKSKATKKIIVGIDKFKPYSYLNNEGDYTGIDVDMARYAFGKMGYEPEFKFIDWEKKDDNLADGTIDCIWSCYSYTGREDKYQWAGPYMKSRQVVAVRNDSDIYTLSDLKNKRIGVQTTTKGEQVFLKRTNVLIPETYNINSFSTSDELLAVLRKGYVDAIAGHEALLLNMDTYNTVTYRLLKESLLDVQIGVAFEKGTHKELADELTKTLEDMARDGVTGEIAQKYGMSPENVVLGGNDGK